MKSLALLAIACALAPAARAADCTATLTNGKTVRAALPLEREPGGPIASGEVRLAGLDVRFESGYGGVDEDASQKYVFQTFSVYRGDSLLLTEDLGEMGQVLDRDLKDRAVRHLRCEL